MATAEAPDLETPEPEWLTEVGYPGAARRHQEGRPVAGRSTIARRSNSGYGPPGCRCPVSASSWFSTGGKRAATEPTGGRRLGPEEMNEVWKMRPAMNHTNIILQAVWFYSDGLDWRILAITRKYLVEISSRKQAWQGLAMLCMS